MISEISFTIYIYSVYTLSSVFQELLASENAWKYAWNWVFYAFFFNEPDTIKHTMINAFLKVMSFYYACLSFDMQLNFQYSHFKTLLYSMIHLY